MQRFVAFIVLFLVMAVHGQFRLEYSESVCERPWFDRLNWCSTCPASSPEALRVHVLKGKPMRVVLQAGNYMEILDVDNININGNVICGEAVLRMTSPLTESPAMEQVLVCTDGYVGKLIDAVNSTDAVERAEDWPANSLTFMTRDYSAEDKPVSSRYLDGSTTVMGLDNIKAMAGKSEFRGVMGDRAYTFKMENTHIDFATEEVSGQSLSYISQTYTQGGGIRIRDYPYHWLSVWSTKGIRDSARWSVGDLKQLKHTNDYVALHWFADSCWSVVYAHTAKGERVSGSIDMLRSYIRMGHRVRVHFNGFTLEAASLAVTSDGIVVAQTAGEMARRGGNKSDKTFFNTKTREVVRLISSNGMVRSYYFFIHTGQLSARPNENFPVLWSVDTRTWKPALEMDSKSKVLLGSSKELLATTGTSNLRARLELKAPNIISRVDNIEYYLELNNVRITDRTAASPDIIGQSLRTVPFFRISDKDEFAIGVYQPEKQYIQVSTVTGVTVATLPRVLTVKPGELTPWDVHSITWFNDERTDPYELAKSF